MEILNYVISFEKLYFSFTDSETNYPVKPSVKFIPLMEQPTKASSSTSTSATDIDSETSTEQLFGFIQPEKTSSEYGCPNDREMVAVVGAKTQKPMQKTSTERKSKNISSKKVKTETHSNDHGPSKRSNKNGTEAKVESMKDLKTSKPQATSPEAANDDFVPSLNEKCSSEFHSTPAIQPSFDDSDSCPTIEVMIESPSVEKDAPMQYYRRKTFKKEIDQSFKVDKILDDWDDSESEHSEKQEKTNMQNFHLKSVECQQNDDAISIISVTSETSDSSLAFVGESYNLTGNEAIQKDQQMAWNCSEMD